MNTESSVGVGSFAHSAIETWTLFKGYDSISCISESLNETTKLVTRGMFSLLLFIAFSDNITVCVMKSDALQLHTTFAMSCSFPVTFPVLKPPQAAVVSHFPSTTG